MSKKSDTTFLNPLTGKNFQIVRTETLNPYTNNARHHPDGQIEKIAESYRKFRMINPLLVNKKYEVIAGHGRLESAKRANLTHVPIIMIEHLTPAETRAYRILDNRIAELSEWNESALAIELHYLVQAELKCEIDFSPEIVGFLSPEIDLRLHGMTGDGNEPPSVLLDTASSVPNISKLGDLWKLGRHRLLCGNSLEQACHDRLLRRVDVRLVSTDPPFNIAIDGFASGNGTVKHANFVMGSGEMSSKEFEDFLYKAIAKSIAHLDDGCCVYVFMDWRHDRELQAAARRCELTQLNLCVWTKNVAGMGSFYRSQHELVFVYKKGKTSHRNNIQLGKFGRNRSNVWNYPSANMSKEGRKALKDHPTPKPVTMIADIIRDTTKTNEVVFDPFMGGGTTLIAAEKTNRICYGIELDPKYMDVCIRRWQALTGKQAVHAETGLTFTEHEERVQNPAQSSQKGERHGRIRER
jgi:DNA modification methylase